MKDDSVHQAGPCRSCWCLRVKGVSRSTGGGRNPQSSMEEATGSPQEEVISQLKSVSVEDSESPSASDKPTNKEHQLMTHRVNEERSVSPTPSYLSMESEQSMSVLMNRKEQDMPDEKEVQTDRAGSPTPSHVSMKSDRSMDIPISFRVGGSTIIEGLCDPCFDDEKKLRAVKTCLTCSSSYCDKHVRRHYTDAKFQTHTLVDVDPAKQQRLCQDHHKPLEVFCWTDNMLICSQCSVTQHRGHYIFVKAEQAAGKERQRLDTVNLFPPGEISFLSVKPDSVTLTWGPPEGLEGPRKFIVTWEGDGEPDNLIIKDMYRVQIIGLQPGQHYDFKVATMGAEGSQSSSISKTVITAVPRPSYLEVLESLDRSLSVEWGRTNGLQLSHRYLITYRSPGSEPLAVHTEHTTGVPSPTDLTTEQLQPSSVTLCWTKPEGMETIPHHFLITYSSPGTESQPTQTGDCCTTLTDLLPGTHYTVGVCTVLDQGGQLSKPASTTIITDGWPMGNCGPTARTEHPHPTSPTLPPARGIQHQFASTARMSYLSPMLTIGGQGGSPFDFNGIDSGATLEKIWVWVGGWQVKALKVWLTDGRSQEFGEPAGKFSEFQFEDGEHFTKLSLWGNGAGTRLGAMKFQTNHSREFFAYMTDWELKTEYPVDVGSGICVGVSGKAGSDMDCLGFQFINTIKSTVLTDVYYPTLQGVIPQVATELIKSVTYKNNFTVPQEYKIETSKTITKKSLWSVTNKFETNFNCLVKAGIPEVAEVSAGYGFTLGTESPHGLEEERSHTECLSFPIDVPAGKTVHVDITIGRVTVDLPFTATVEITCLNNSVLRFKISGTYKGLTYTDAKVVVVTTSA
ncbi:uncharacterized protein LOC134017749 isoform X1 [Osmerus eperlanus]|uniref:uncharacterized protein LOC134017749 isoform X1 n=4 Tax=Osmerus eperlanus TaxID=29151 RepID=UPI002E148B97